MAALLMAALLLWSPHALAQTQALPPFDGIAAVVNGEVISIGEVRRTALLAREDKLGVGALCEGQAMPAVELARGDIPAGLASALESA